MKSIIYSIISIILFSQSLIGQTKYFNNIYNPNSSWAIGLSIISNDSNYICIGRSYDSSKTSNTIILLSINKNGILDTVINYGDTLTTNYPGFCSLVKSYENGYFISGSVNIDGNSYGLIMNLDSDFNLKWKRVLGDTINNFIFLQGKPTSDSGYIITGDIYKNPNDNDILLIKTDSLGNKLWQKTYNYIGADRGWNVIQTPDKGYLIGAGGYKAGVPNSYNGLVIKTDSLGNEQWRRSFGGMYDDDKCVVANHPDGSFIVATSYSVIDSFPNDLDDDGYKTINVIKLSPSNQVLWNNQYDFPKFWRSVGNISIKASGDIFVMGKWRGNDANSVQRSSLLKLNSNGDSLWYREFTKFTDHASDNALYDIKPTEDKGFVMCGQADAPFTPYQSQHIWVLKVDSFGCDTPGCHTVGINTSAPLSVLNTLVYPNPALDEITIDFRGFTKVETINIVIYNSVGLLIRREKAAKNINTKTINIKDFSPGIYYYQIISNDKSYSGKFVKM
ncbi:MAG: T9SS type A sorting domain-containing protein [Saprospiraceae bacterium]|nr:T9SS type A sorting domain-containing protein [Saprospiraceae bacterium]